MGTEVTWQPTSGELACYTSDGKQFRVVLVLIGTARVGGQEGGTPPPKWSYCQWSQEGVIQHSYMPHDRLFSTDEVTPVHHRMCVVQ